MLQAISEVLKHYVPEVAKLVSSFKLSKLPAQKALEAPRDEDGNLVSSQCGRIKLFKKFLRGYSDKEIEDERVGLDATPCAATLGYIFQIDSSEKKLFTAFLLMFADESFKLSTWKTVEGNLTKWKRKASIEEVRDVPAYASQFLLLDTGFDERFINWIDSNWKRFKSEAQALRDTAKSEARKSATKS
jgi:hypothetical protein